MQREQHTSPLIDGNKSRFLRATHIFVIVFSAVMFFLSAVIDGVWFDEAYTVAAVSNGMRDMINYLTHDVHPHLYYIFLKFWSFIFGEGIIALRLFSATFAVLTVGLGYTHIRKDFGERVGFWFSVSTVFSFPMLKYALQIRMYTLAIFLLTLTGIYVWRYINTESKKYRRLYLLVSVLSAYMHYFAFFIVAMINVFTLFCALRKKKTKRWVADAVIQFAGYSAGLAVFVYQITLDGANWIRVFYPDVIFDTAVHPFVATPLSFHFERDSSLYYIIGTVALVVVISVFVFLFGKYKNDKEKFGAPFFGFCLCLAVFAFSLAVSVFRPIYHQRYSVLFTGFFVFSLAFVLAEMNLKWVRRAISLALVICFLITAIPFWKENLEVKDETYSDLIDVREGDVIITDDFHAFVYTIKFKENDIVFYNPWSWPVEKTYPIFSKKLDIMQDISEFSSYDGRIIACGKETIAFFENCESATMIEEKHYFPNYYDEFNNFEKYDLIFRIYEVKAN